MNTRMTKMKKSANNWAENIYQSPLILLLVALNCLGSVSAQVEVTLEQITRIALENNALNSLNDIQIKKAEYEIKATKERPKTGVFIENEDFRPSDSQGIWKVGLSQELPWPGLNKAKKTYKEQVLETHKLNRAVIEAGIKRDVKMTYYELWYLQDKKNLYQQLDSLYKKLFDAATIRYNVGDVAGLDKISAEVKFFEVQALLNQVARDIESSQQELMLLTASEVSFLAVNTDLEKVESQIDLAPYSHPNLLLQQQNIAVSQSLIEVQKKSNRPEFSARVFSQSYLGLDDPYSGFSFTVAFPMFGSKALKNKVKALQAEVDFQNSTLKWQQMKLDSERETARIRLEKEEIMLNFYENSGLKKADSILSASALSYRSGEISYAELSQFVAQAISIKQNYLDALNMFNQAMIEYQYLLNQI